jgi:uncharacterized glyoxalase superfamily protein PhnB
MDALPTVFPTLLYDDPNAAIEFLCEAFGAERHAVHAEDGLIRHAELRLGNGIVMLGPSRPDSPASSRCASSVYVVVSDPDAHHARAKAAGAEIVREPNDTDYGSRDYAARDLEQNVWYFGTYQPFSYSSDEVDATEPLLRS